MNVHESFENNLPPYAITDAAGKPLLSWRVAILPYIDQKPLYDQFDLTKPWDDPRNKALIAKMPAIFITPGAEAKEGETHYRVFVGPGSVFEKGVKMSGAKIKDGFSNTIYAVEAAESTIWTKPDELPFDPNGQLPKLGISPDGFIAVFGDATVRFIRAGTSAELIRAYITANGGEAVPLPD
jgi:hypothetical protein